MKKPIFIILFIVCSFQVVNCQDSKLSNGIYNVTTNITIPYCEIFNEIVYIYDECLTFYKPDDTFSSMGFYLYFNRPIYKACNSYGWCVEFSSNRTILTGQFHFAFGNVVCPFTAKRISDYTGPIGSETQSTTWEIYTILGVIALIFFILFTITFIKYKDLKEKMEFRQYVQLNQ